VTPRAVRLPDGRVWLRVADPGWKNPLDPSHAARAGGRWNPPRSHSTLYLNGDVATARAQLGRMLRGSPARIDDLRDDAYVLVAATLPRAQRCADAASPQGLRALGLPATYPLTERGREVARRRCQTVGAAVRESGLRGVWCRSAARTDGEGRELAWFPATRRSVARPVWERPLPLGAWRHAVSWGDVGLGDQREPEVDRAG
jgi:hypothetical protein